MKKSAPLAEFAEAHILSSYFYIREKFPDVFRVNSSHVLKFCVETVDRFEALDEPVLIVVKLRAYPG